MKKRLYSILAILLVAGLLLGACTPKEPVAEPVVEQPVEQPVEKPVEEPAKTFKVGLVTDVGVVDDKNFNQATWEGVVAAQEELGFEAKYIETKDAKDYDANIQLFVDEGFDVIVTVGFALGEATINAAKANPGVAFIGVDQFQGEEVPGVAGLVFEEALSGVLAGVLAANLTESNTVAAVLGTDLVPPVVNYNRGYVGGAKWVNPEINIISTYHPGGMDVAFTDPEWGASTAKQAIEQGADVVFAAAGNTGNGALIETAQHAGLFCIGVDTDQWLTVPEAHKCLISSATKDITLSVVELIKLAYEGKFPSGNYVGGSSLAPFHDFESMITDEIRTKLEEALEAYNAGEIELPEK